MRIGVRRCCRVAASQVRIEGLFCSAVLVESLSSSFKLLRRAGSKRGRWLKGPGRLEWCLVT